MPQALFLEEKRRFWYSMNEESKQPFETEARDKHIASLFDFEKKLVRTLSKDQKTGKRSTTPIASVHYCSSTPDYPAKTH